MSAGWQTDLSVYEVVVAHLPDPPTGSVGLLLLLVSRSSKLTISPGVG